MKPMSELQTEASSTTPAPNVLFQELNGTSVAQCNKPLLIPSWSTGSQLLYCQPGSKFRTSAWTALTFAAVWGYKLLLEDTFISVCLPSLYISDKSVFFKKKFSIVQLMTPWTVVFVIWIIVCAVIITAYSAVEGFQHCIFLLCNRLMKQ